MKPKIEGLTSIAIIIVGLMIVGTLLYGGLNGWFGTSIFNRFDNSSTPYPDDIDDEYDSYVALLSLTPNWICSGDQVIGNINSNIQSGFCSIFTDTGTGWTLFRNVLLDEHGDYTEAGVVTAIGHADFIAVCCDFEGNCKISNAAELTVEACDDSDDDDSSGYTCGDNGDYMCAGTCPATYPSCDIVNFGDYDTCVCINEDTEQIAPDWKPTGTEHNEDLFDNYGADCGTIYEQCSIGFCPNLGQLTGKCMSLDSGWCGCFAGRPDTCLGTLSEAEDIALDFLDGWFAYADNDFNTCSGSIDSITQLSTKSWLFGTTYTCVGNGIGEYYLDVTIDNCIITDPEMIV